MIFAFDFDGVLVDSFETVRTVCCEQFKRRGLEQLCSKDAFASLYNRNFFTSANEHGFDLSEVPQFLKEIEVEFHTLYPRVPVFPQVLASIKEIARRSPTYIITSNVKAIVGRVLTQNDLLIPILGAEFSLSKEDKFTFLKKQHATQRLCYVCDTLGDIREAKAQRCLVIAVTWGYHDHALLAQGHPDHLVTDPSVLHQILLELAQDSSVQ